ncbi:MAG: hypothetical protein ACYC10_04675 [Allorhizobium sp.]
MENSPSVLSATLPGTAWAARHSPPLRACRPADWPFPSSVASGAPTGEKKPGGTRSFQMRRIAQVG